MKCHSNELIVSITEILDTDFEKELFEAALYNLNDKNNKLRYNNFSYSIRELSRHFLYRLAPDKEVKACKWYKEQGKGGATRVQRIKYAIQGGITDEDLDGLGYDSKRINEDIRFIKGRIDTLSKYTHVNSESFDIHSDKGDQFVHDVLYAFSCFANNIKAHNHHLLSFLDNKIERYLISEIISESHNSIDRIAPKHSLYNIHILKYQIVKIDHAAVIVEVDGIIEFILEYGSKEERRNEEGVDMKVCFPFLSEIHFNIKPHFPSSDYRMSKYIVEIKSWYN